MEGFGDKKLAMFLQGVIRDFEADNDTVRALRRLHMKEVHLKQDYDPRGLKLVKKVRRFV